MYIAVLWKKYTPLKTIKQVPQSNYTYLYSIKPIIYSSCLSVLCFMLYSFVFLQYV